MLPDDTIPLPRHRRFDSGGFVAGVLALVLLGFGGLILGLAYGQRGGSTASPADAPVATPAPSAASPSDNPGPVDAAAGPPVPVVLPSPSDEKPRQSQGTAGSNNTRVAGGAATAAGKVKAKKPHRSSGLLRRR